MTQLGAPFKIVDGDVSPFRLEVAKRIAAIRTAAGLPAGAPLLPADRARVRTEVAREFFLAEHGREPADARELAGQIAKDSRRWHRRFAEHGASVALVARRRDRLEALGAEIDKAGGTLLIVEADITDRTQAEEAVQQAVERFGRLDTLVNNAGVMLLGPVVGADTEEWDRMIAINVQGLLHTTRAALPHLLQAAEEGPRRVADIVNISSIAGRVAWNGYGVYSFTKFGVNGFTEGLRQEVTQRHVRVGVVEPGGVATELGLHNKPEVATR